MKQTRRLFLKRVALTGGALATAHAVAAPVARLTRAEPCGSNLLPPEPLMPAKPLNSGFAAAPVVAFFDGQLWLDGSGASTPYRAPLGARAAAPLETLSDADLRSLYGCL